MSTIYLYIVTVCRVSITTVDELLTLHTCCPPFCNTLPQVTELWPVSLASEVSGLFVWYHLIYSSLGLGSSGYLSFLTILVKYDKVDPTAYV